MEPWVWDWCQDHYRYADSGKFVDSGEHCHNNDNEDDLPEVTLFICKCGSVNSTMLFLNGQTVMTFVKPWKNIDWEKCSWEDDC